MVEFILGAMFGGRGFDLILGAIFGILIYRKITKREKK